MTQIGNFTVMWSDNDEEVCDFCGEPLNGYPWDECECQEDWYE